MMGAISPSAPLATPMMFTGFPCSFYLRCRLASGEGIVSLGVRLSRCVCVRRISLDGEGNVLYLVFSSFVIVLCSGRVR